MTHITIERAKAQRIADAFEDLKKNHGIVYVEESVDIKQALAAPPTHKTARWTDEEYREISDQVISTLVEYGAELRTADCQMQILREELAESRREVAQLKAQPAPVQPVACFIGAKGSAFDAPETKRAYTYKEQPGNAVASKLGRACDAASKQRAGDNIDRGLGLLQELQKEGFGVFDLGAEYTAAQPAVPDAMTSADIQEHIEYVAGWNDCRQAMLEMMKSRGNT